MLYNNYTAHQYKSHHIIIPATQNTGALLLGDLNAATDEQVIKLYNIKTIITAACGLQHLKIPSLLTHIVFPLMDTKQQNIQTYFQLSYRTIDENLKKGSVLVHCGAGISRSASLIIAYYMKKYNSPFKAAIGYVRKIKPNICPNIGFQLQLKNYQQKLQIPNKQANMSTRQSINSSNIYKNTKRYQNQQPVTSSYLFQIPLQNQNNLRYKNKSKTLNRNFNKTHGSKIHHERIQNKNGSLFITGKNMDKQIGIQKKFDFYQPNNYSRKHSTKQKYQYLPDQKEQNKTIFKF